MGIDLGKIISSHRKLTDWTRTGFSAHHTEIDRLGKDGLRFVSANIFESWNNSIQYWADRSYKLPVINYADWRPLLYTATGNGYSEAPPDLDLITFDEGNLKILSGVEGQIGMIQGPYEAERNNDHYQLDVEIHVKDAGSGPVGLILAVEPASSMDVAPRSVIVLRSPGHNGLRFAVLNNYILIPERTMIVDKSHTCKWGNGAAGDKLPTEVGYQQTNPNHNWKGQNDKYGDKAYVRIRVERDGQRFKIWTTDFGSPEKLIDDPIIFNMMDVGQSESLRYDNNIQGPFTDQQGGVTWKYRHMSDLSQLYYDVMTDKTYRIEEGVITDVTAQHPITELGENIFLYSRLTNDVYFLNHEGIAQSMQVF